MASTPQSQAIATVNGLLSCALELNNLTVSIMALNNMWTDAAVANTLAAMGTVALNSDGTQGVIDPTPVSSHPLNLNLYPGLTRSISPNQVASLLTILQAIPNYVAGQAIPATGGVRAILNNSIG